MLIVETKMAAARHFSIAMLIASLGLAMLSPYALLRQTRAACAAGRPAIRFSADS
jgi:hypothetical protein